MLNILNIEVSTHVKHTKHRYLHSTLMLKCCTFRYLHMLNILNIEVSTHVKHAKHWYLHSTWMLNIFLNNNYFTVRGGVRDLQYVSDIVEGNLSKYGISFPGWSGVARRAAALYGLPDPLELFEQP